MKGILLDDICKKKKMNLAFNQHREFKVDEEVGVTIKFPVRPTRGRSISAWNWEIVDTFLHRHHITPDWINCNGSWGALGIKRDIIFILYII